MNGIDALVFTAGIGENQANIREAVCENMEFFGIEFKNVGFGDFKTIGDVLNYIEEQVK